MASAVQMSLAKSSFVGQIPSRFQAAAETAKPAASVKIVALNKQSQANVAAGAAVATTLLTAGSARALEAEEIASALDQVESIARQTADAAFQAYGVAKQVTDQVVEAATPFVKAAAPVVADAAKKAVDAATPVVNDLADQATKALSQQGVEIAPVLSASKNAVGVATDVAGDAYTAAQPVAQATFDTLSVQDPAVLAAGAGALVLVYLLTPSFFESVVSGARGFAGEYSAAQALDLLSKEDYTLVDVRSDNQKAKSGVPSLPRNVKSKLVFVPVEEVDGKLRGQVRNAKKVESEIAALKIAALKRLSKGSRVILIDNNGESAKLVAQALVALGFKNTWIVRDGVDGGRGWVASRLATEAVSYSLAEVLSPSRILSGRGTGTVQVPSRRALPSGSD